MTLLAANLGGRLMADLSDSGRDASTQVANLGTVTERLRIQCEIHAAIEEHGGWPDDFQTEAPEK